MQFSIVNQAREHDIPIASIQTKKIYSDDVIHLVDFAGQIEENGLPGLRDIQAYPTGGADPIDKYKLDTNNIFHTIQITDEYYYDSSNGVITPLWYYHGLKRQYFNSQTTNKTVRRVIREGYTTSDREVSALIPSNGNYVIPIGSVSVTKNGALVHRSLYYVDYSRGIVTLPESVANDIYVISYKLTTIDINISMTKYSMYRVEVTMLGTDSNYFCAAVLSSDPSSLTVTYNSSITLGRVDQITEETDPVLLFSKVTETQRQAFASDTENNIQARRVYSFYDVADPVHGTKYIYTTSYNRNHQFTFRAGSSDYTKIHLGKPMHQNYFRDWYPTVTPGSFEAFGRTYTVSSTGVSRAQIKEKATFIDKNHISVSNKNILTSITRLGLNSNITVVRDGSCLTIDKVDRENGIITLSDEVVRDDEIEVTYVVESNENTVSNICLNPLQTHSMHNGSTSTLSTTFDVGYGPETTLIRTIAVQPDNKVIIAGDFYAYDGYRRNHIARVNEDGTIDTSFDPGTGTNNFAIHNIALQPDGKTILVGDFTTYDNITRSRIARANADGSLDLSFDPGAGANNQIISLALNQDESTVIVGSFTKYNNIAANRIARVTSTGALDATFGSGTGANSSIGVILPLADGSYIITGAFTTYNGIARTRIAKITASGTLDTNFNPGTGTDGDIASVAVQQDGKILIGGSFTLYNGVVRNRLARINPNGTLDANFDPGYGTDNAIKSIVVQPDDGKILIAGQFISYNAVAAPRIARLNTDGSIDRTFDPGIGPNRNLLRICLQSSGKLIILGNQTSYNGTDRLHIARLNTDGSLDTSFTSGIGAHSMVNTITAQSDSRIIVGGGFTYYGGVERHNVARINPDGSLDTSFTPGSGADDIIYASAFQSDGKILIGGAFTRYNGTAANRITRLNTNGLIDTTYKIGNGADGIVNTISLQDDGKAIIGGSFYAYNGISRSYIARINSVGALDLNFNPNLGPDGSVLATYIQEDDKIIVGGTFTTYDGIGRNQIARLTTSGTLDETFDPGTGVNGSGVEAIAQQTDGKLIIGGFFSAYNDTSSNNIARINTDGSLDTTFNCGTGTNAPVSSILVLPDDKIMIAGSFTTYNGYERQRVALLNSDGSLDTIFLQDTVLDQPVNTLVRMLDGRITIGGYFAHHNDQSVQCLSVINTTTATSNYNVSVFALVDDSDILSSNILTMLLPYSVNGKPFVYSYQYLDSLLNNSDPIIRNTNRMKFSGLPLSYLSTIESSDPLLVKPMFLLGLMYVVNPLDEDGFLIEDARLYGGGTEEYNRSFFDWSYFDGECIDMESLIHVKVPQTVYNNLVSRSLEWDSDVIQSEYPETSASTRAMSLIREKIKKFSQLGTVQELEIG